MSVKKDNKKKGEKPPKARRQERDEYVPKTVDGKELRGIVRIAGKDIKGHYKLTRAIQSIKGMGPTIGKVLSEIVIRELKLKETVLIGELEEKQIEQLENILTNPLKYNVPKHLLNRQREFESGDIRQMIATDLTYQIKQDIDHEKDVQTWRGYRHNYGQKVRGQHTRSTGRKGTTMGVIRKAAQNKGAQPADAKKQDKKK
jgi:small subunit ribosomal protein S13